MLEIRPLTLADADSWAALLAVSFNRTPAQMVALLHHFYGPLASAPQCSIAFDERRLVAWGAWAGAQLAAQYSCLLTPLWLPEQAGVQTVGMSMNMAVHPAYRGQGLIKRVAEPVYAEVAGRGAIAGVGFSNAAGVQVDQKSQGYGYRVVGKMGSLLAVVGRKRPLSPRIALTTRWPAALQPVSTVPTAVQFAATPETLRHRFGQHPFRGYHYGVAEGEMGVVVYRPFVWRGLRGASLLAAYGANTNLLIGSWVNALAADKIRLVHLLTSPQSTLRQALQAHGWCLPLPLSQNPHYLTAKPLTASLSSPLFNFSHWDCAGGDIL